MNITLLFSVQYLQVHRDIALLSDDVTFAHTHSLSSPFLSQIT